VAQPQQQSRVERVELQSKDSPKSALNKSSSETTSSSMQSHSAENNGKKNIYERKFFFTY
jgi:hypothetical protein